MNIFSATIFVLMLLSGFSLIIYGITLTIESTKIIEQNCYDSRGMEIQGLKCMGYDYSDLGWSFVGMFIVGLSLLSFSPLNNCGRN